MKKTKLITLLIFLLVIPITLFLGTKIPGRGYYITGTLIIIEMLIPFFLAFEGRRVQARELLP
jgi:energy-coupling factor transport system ATP-binding protein